MAGSNSPENMPIGHLSSTGLIPLRGKPALGWILEGLFENGADEIILVLNKDNKKQINYIKNVYSKFLKIKIIEISGKQSILHSLKAGLKAADSAHPTRIILGDTLIAQKLPRKTNLVLTSKNIGFSDYWCLIDKNENNTVLNFYDKKKNLDLSNKEALIGYYSVSDTRYLLNCIRLAIYQRGGEISFALDTYRKKRPLKAELAEKWFDLGHTRGIVEARNNLFNARSFNSIVTDIQLGTLTKNSTKIEKLEDEACWYEAMPDELKILSPRLISFTKNDDYASLVQELYGYPSLQEMFLFGEVNLEDWELILTKLFDTHKLFEKHTSTTNKEDINYLYKTKTWQRLEDLESQDEFWAKTLKEDYININNTTYVNIHKLKPKIDTYIEKLVDSSKTTIIHGDYCFSNILFDPINFVFKLIDPRGRLQEQTIYGDPRYDIAKLRHSVIGHYDFVVNGLFKLIEENGNYNFEILTGVDYSPLRNVFDDLTRKNGFDTIEIQFIEALLFLSMIPLHKDCLQRQKIFYLKSIILLNEVFV